MYVYAYVLWPLVKFVCIFVLLISYCCYVFLPNDNKLNIACLQCTHPFSIPSPIPEIYSQYQRPLQDSTLLLYQKTYIPSSFFPCCQQSSTLLYALKGHMLLRKLLVIFFKLPLSLYI